MSVKTFDEYVNKVVEYGCNVEVQRSVYGGQSYSFKGKASVELVKQLLATEKEGCLRFVSQSHFDDTCYLWFDLKKRTFGGWLPRADRWRE